MNFRPRHIQEHTHGRRTIFSYLISVIFFLLPAMAEAQFFSLGTDPGSTRWMQMKTVNYNIIFPEGMDSLAREYAYNLEKYRHLSLHGMGIWGKRMPVVLHPYLSTANGMVMWAPKRMELLTTPSGYEASATPWSEHLAMHESRHIGHINNFNRGVFKPFTWILGEQAAGLFFGAFQNTYMYEGDAVVTETALSEGGRGREGKFLSYYMAAFDSGDYRNRDRWICGSYRHYTPDNYAYGYMLGSSIIYGTGNYNYYPEILEMIRKRPYIPWISNIAYRKVTGKSKKELHEEAIGLYSKMWEEAKKRRAPVTGYKDMVRTPRRYSEYTSAAKGADGKIYMVKWGLQQAYSLVSIDSTGKERFEIPFSYNAGRITASPDKGTLYWTESVGDIRWSLKESSDIFSYDIIKRKKERITRNGRYWNTTISEDGRHIASTVYDHDGRYSLAIIDISTGEETARAFCPENVRFTENTWAGDYIYSLAVTGEGMAIYRTETEGGKISGTPELFMEPEPVNISGIGYHDGYITYISDRDGVDNLYGTDLSGKTKVQYISSEYGINSYLFDRDTIIYSALRHEGYVPVKSPCRPFTPQDSAIYRNRIAENLSEKAEESIPEALFRHKPDTASYKTKRYSKLSHLFRLHSWAPFYYDVDKIRSISFDNITNAASPGITFQSQNTLGTAETMAAYFYKNGRHGGEIKLSYSGLWPVIELDAKFNERAFTDNTVNFNTGKVTVSDNKGSCEDPGLSANLKLYVPMSINYGGWFRGIIPQVSFGYSNDRYIFIKGLEKDRHDFISTSTASVRYYQMRQTATSEVYPRFGFGIEAGYVAPMNMREYIGDKAYGYVYCYLPGFRGQGFRLTAMHARNIGEKPLTLNALNLMPRGITAEAGKYVNPLTGTLATIDYAIPVHMGDISIPGTLYFRRAVAKPFFDIVIDHKNSRGKYCFTTGADITFEIRIFNLPYPIEIGTRLAYCSGDLIQTVPQNRRFYAGLLFNMSFE